jgi:hypothetical protein
MSNFEVENTDSFDYLSDSDEAWDGLEAFIAEDSAPKFSNQIRPYNKRSFETENDDLDFSNPNKVARLVTDVSS